MAKKKGGQKKPTKVYTYYKAGGDKIERQKKQCPKCGDGVFLAAHKDRLTCGKCQYTEKIHA